jgi:hypothetical protein
MDALRLLRILRSRRLAISLLVGLTLYALVATTRFPGAFTNPVFVAGVLVLIVATTQCAWERTRALFRSLRGASASRPARTLGLLGSTLFHWSLAGLFVLAGFGQLGRYAGTVHATLDRPVTEARSSYDSGLEIARPFAPSFSGLTIEIDGLDRRFVSGGVDRGPTPHVVARNRDSIVASGWVYPNSPLRAGPLAIHRAKTGPALEATLRDAGDASTRRMTRYYSFDTPISDSFGVESASTTGVVVVELAAVPGERLAVRARNADGTLLASRTVGPGEPVEIVRGLTFTVDRLTAFATLSIVNDPTVSLIYAMFAVALAGMSLALFTPWRGVVRREGSSDGLAEEDAQ